MRKFIKSVDARVYLVLLIFTIFVYFVISPDSYMHNLTSHLDSSCFFMCGKAWMNGMVPYVDFADSKGPLLWLIYGIGYLISPYDFVGVYWMGVLFYSLILFFCYKIGCLLTNNKRAGLAVAFVMIVSYFFNYFEPKPESWCQLPIAASLYYMLREILSPTGKSSRQVGIVLGISFMSAVLIKWSIAVMMLSFSISLLYILLRRKQTVVPFLLYFAISAFLVFLPFLIYMLATNSFGAFIQEYFLNTGQSVSKGGKLGFIVSYFTDDLKAQFLKAQYLVTFTVYALYLVFAFLYYRKHREITILPVLCGVFFLALSIKFPHWNYYKTVNSTFAIFLVLFVVEIMVKHIRLHQKALFVIALISAFTALSIDTMTCISRKDSIYNKYNNAYNKGFYDAAYVMSQRKKPTIIIETEEISVGLPVNSLPGTRYWTGQYGATEQMTNERLKAVDSHQSDFLLIKPQSEWKERAVRAGYQHYLSCMDHELYGPKGLKMPPKDFSVSKMDIMLKRKIEFADEN